MLVKAVCFLGLASFLLFPSSDADAGQLDSITQIRSGETVMLVSGPWRALARLEPLGGAFELDLIVSGEADGSDPLKASVTLAPGQRHRVIVRGEDGKPGGFEALRDGDEIVLTAFHPATLPPPGPALAPRLVEPMPLAQLHPTLR